jgi:hypothetical protein
MASKNELLEFLDKHVFLRILHASERDLSIKQLDDLKDLKHRTHEEMGRYHGYNSAEQVVEAYNQDVHNEAAKAINARLQDLNLPRFVDVRDEFLALAGR